MRNLAIGILALGTLLAAQAGDGASAALPGPTLAEVRAAIERGSAFLLRTQNADGSWGGAADSLTTWGGWTWSNPESHRAWRVATTGLCALALLEVGTTPEAEAATDRALGYLAASDVVKRPSEWDTMGCWAYIYGLQALAAASGHPRYAAAPLRARLRAAAELHLRQLAYHQSLSGGWGYLEFDEPRTARPQWATSFTTAAGVVALVEARTQGLPVDAAMLERAVRAVRRCRLPGGAYTYSVQAIPHPRRIGSIDRVNGSLGRIQVCNVALRMAGDDIPSEQIRAGLDVFFREHRFLDIALHKPVPHEAFYQNSGYFYLFGHYYAALAVAELPQEERRELWPLLAREVIKVQQKDGSLWDYDHHAYDRAYGTAYGLMALGRIAADGAGEDGASRALHGPGPEPRPENSENRTAPGAQAVDTCRAGS